MGPKSQSVNVRYRSETFPLGLSRRETTHCSLCAPGLSRLYRSKLVLDASFSLPYRSGFSRLIIKISDARRGWPYYIMPLLSISLQVQLGRIMCEAKVRPALKACPSLYF